MYENIAYWKIEFLLIMEKLFKSSIVGWIELFVLMAGVFSVFINYNLPIATGYDKVSDIPLIFLSLGIVWFWKQLVEKKLTFGYMADISGMLAVFAIIFSMEFDKMEFWAIISFVIGLIIDLLRTYYCQSNE